MSTTSASTRPAKYMYVVSAGMATNSPTAVVKRAIRDAAGKLVRLSHGLGSGDLVKTLDHPDHGSQKAQQGADRGDGIQHAEMAAELADLPLSAIDDCLFDFDAGLAPFADAVGEDLGDRAAIFFA